MVNNVAPVMNRESLEYCLLRLGPRDKKGSPVRKFANLARILAKRNITMRWKTAKSPSVLDSYNEVIRWGRAEGAELKREEHRGLRKKPISLEWNEMLEEFIATDVQA